MYITESSTRKLISNFQLPERFARLATSPYISFDNSVIDDFNVRFAHSLSSFCARRSSQSSWNWDLVFLIFHIFSRHVQLTSVGDPIELFVQHFGSDALQTK